MAGRYGDRLNKSGERLTQDADCRALEIAYLRVFEPEDPGYFHLIRGNYPGIHDGTEGVQWNAYHDHTEDRVTLGVNLEGEKYDDWPIARLIDRELKKSILPSVAAGVAGQLAPGTDVRIHIWRDTLINERSKKRDGDNVRDFGARELTVEDWRRALIEARAYLADGGRGRRHLPPPHEHLSTCPHLQVATTVWVAMPATHAERIASMSAARTRLQSFHEWAVRQSRP